MCLMNRFFIAEDFEINQSYPLPDAVFHHWGRVLRANIGDQAIVFNGKSGEYLAEIVQLDKKSAQIKIIEFNPIQRHLPTQVILGQVMSKGDRMDYAIQKATELGVYQIQLLTSERCEMRLKYDRDQKKIEHWQAVAISACEQCGLNIVPQILAPIPMQDWVHQVQAEQKLVLALSEGQVQFQSPLPARIALLVGAEGGLSEAEIDVAVQAGFQKWTIGERVLRTETAPVAALAVLNYLQQNAL